MITISRQGNDYKMFFSNPGTNVRGFLAIAKSIDEIHHAINHYYVNGTCKSPEDCPLCRKRKKK